jgi:hypothetical protein
LISTMQLRQLINIFLKRVRILVVYTLLGLFMIMGSWCLPPKMIEKVIKNIGAKHNIEFVVDKKGNGK